MLKKLGAEAILTGMIFPVVIGVLFWFFSFVMTSYQTIAEVSNIKNDIQEIKTNVKDTNADVKDILKSLGAK